VIYKLRDSRQTADNRQYRRRRRWEGIMEQHLLHVGKKDGDALA